MYTTMIDGNNATLTINHAGYGQYNLGLLIDGNKYSSYSTDSQLIDDIKSDINTPADELKVNNAIYNAAMFVFANNGYPTSL